MDAYGVFIELALKRAHEWGAYISEPQTAKAFISEDDDVIIRSWRAESDGYDGYEIGQEETAIPLAFVLGDEDNRAELLARKKATAEAERAAWYARERAAQEQRELAILQALKRKYGG